MGFNSNEAHFLYFLLKLRLQFQHTFITQTTSFVFPFGDVGDVLGFGFGQN
jgi:hypothetical protein